MYEKQKHHSNRDGFSSLEKRNSFVLNTNSAVIILTSKSEIQIYTKLRRDKIENE